MPTLDCSIHLERGMPRWILKEHEDLPLVSSKVGFPWAEKRIFARWIPSPESSDGSSNELDFRSISTNARIRSSRDGE